MKHIPLALLFCLALGLGGLSACSSSSSSDDSDSQSQVDGDSDRESDSDTQTADGDSDSESQAPDGDSDSESQADGDSDSESQAPDGDSDSESSDGDSTSDFDGFAVRVPQQRELVCPGEDGSTSETDTYQDDDYICRINQGGLDIEIYMQATPTSCSSLSYPLFDADHTHLWVKQNGNITELTTAAYEFGGRHHNDLIDFTFAGKSYELWHSSLGWGGRSCAAPDCLIVCKDGVTCQHGDAANVATDGCAREAGGAKPPMPVLCSEVALDGSVPALADPWTTAGDGVNNMVLPCAGDLGEGL